MAVTGKHGYRNTRWRGLTPGTGPEAFYLPRRFTYSGQFTGIGPSAGFGPLISGEDFGPEVIPIVGWPMAAVFPAVVMSWTFAVVPISGRSAFKIGIKLDAVSSVGIFNGDFEYVSPLIEDYIYPNFLSSFACPWSGMSGIGLVTLFANMELNCTPTVYVDEP